MYAARPRCDHLSAVSPIPVDDDHMEAEVITPEHVHASFFPNHYPLVADINLTF